MGLPRHTRPDSFLRCAAAQEKFGKTPLLVDDEMEAQYKKVYKRAMQGHDSSAQINLVNACHHCINLASRPCLSRPL